SHIDYGNWACFEIEEVGIKVYWSVSDFEKNREGGVSDCVTSVVVEST
ncbi:hypothetical protein A2U01_0106897, partial [Trifolium medium]|nr:hypothetical protein [Trifolium medium]